ncbi:hypothetical protein [Bacillus smithii]|uniref:hypothetical protein n=1 Tax=Bacillus smithii TaxID=1479 RepID=UPI002E230FF5|nr:hypothetical protein [Bacillus smithii]MED4928430.1 hypothetical protein [Bacillus smithii]
MSEHKGAILLVVVAIVLFGIFVAFSTGVVQPLVSKIGANLNTMVTNVFSGIGVD